MNKYIVSNIYLNIFFVFILLMLLTTTYFSYTQIEKIKKSYEWIKHTNLVMQNTNDVFEQLMGAESITRGYLITDDSSMIYNLDDKINQTLENLEKGLLLTKDNPTQYALYKKLESYILKRIELLKNSINLKKSALYDSDKRYMSEVHNAQALNNEIKILIDQIYENEEKLMQGRESNFLNQFSVSNIITTAINIFNIIFLLFIIMTFNKMINRLIKIQTNASKSESVLKGIIGGSNEYIAALDLNYIFVAFNESFANEFRHNFGKKPILGESMKAILEENGDQGEKGIALWTRALKGEEFTVTESFGPENDLKQYEITFTSIYNDENKLIGASHIVRDVGERVRKEIELKKFTEKLEDSYKNIELKAEEMTILNEMNNVFRSSISLDETLSISTIYLKKLLPECAGAIYLMKHSKNYLEEVVEWNNVNLAETIFAPDQCWALRQGKIYYFINKKEGVPCKHCEFKNEEVVPYLCVPLLALNEIVGVLYLQIINFSGDINKINQFVETKTIMIQNLAGQIALAISNIKLQDYLKIRSTRDVLTNLYNRSYLDETFDRDIQRAKRNNVQLAVVMMDLDHFKNVNDTFGHDAGDVVLRETAKLLTKELRKSDIACRYGGEEILIILYDTNLENAIKKIESIRLHISEMEFKFVELLTITASFGIAMFPEDGQTSENLIKAADEALYQSKLNGRNQITVFNKINENKV